MGEVKNLQRDAATEKLKELAEDIKVCMFCTDLGSAPFQTRPMGLQQIDDSGNLWFMSSSESDKNAEIQNDQDVQLIFSKNSDAHFLNVFGKATILRDKAKLDEVWNGLAKAWFTEGKDDPKITLIKVQPTEAYYWDTKDGKMISLIKIAAAAVTGKSMDGGIEGRLRV